MSGVPWGELKAPDEEYLKVAVTRLLPQYYGVRADGGAGNALRKMAEAFMVRHGDAWLRDTLKTVHSRRAAEAFAALGRAARADEVVDPVRASPDARTAVRLFRALASEAAALRAEFEYVYSLQLRNAFDACAAAAEPLLQAAKPRPYPWLIGGIFTEAGVCLERSGDFERSATRWQDARSYAGRFSYPVMRLRALGFIAVRLRRIGNTAQAWREDFHGLTLYWDGNYPLSRAQQFYSDLGFLAEDTDLANTSAAVSRENEEITKILGLTERQAGALAQRAMSEIAAGFPDLAMEHLREAHRLADTLPTAAQQLTFTLNTETDMAAVEARRGDVDGPLARLMAIKPQIENSDALLKLRFAAELGRLRLRLGQYPEAQKLLQSAFTIGDKSRALTSETERPLWMRTMANTARALVECEVRTVPDPESSWALWARYRDALFDPKTPSSINAPVVPPRHAVLSFVELPSGLGVWLRTNQKLSFRKLGLPLQTIGEAAGRLTRGCASERSPEAVLRADARELSQWLLGPWDHDLDSVRTVAIETDDPVSALPWPALVRSNGHYWTEDFAIEVRAGASRTAESNSPLDSLQEALAVGEPAIGANINLPPLPEARGQAEKVYSLFPRSILLEGQNATLPQVRMYLRSAQLFHFAGHGYGGEGGGLILSGTAGGAAMLRAADIRNLDLSRCLLAVLSGCSTGSGELHGPGDPQSLVRAFLRAGVREVVASYWDLSSSGTSKFMQEFYGAMLNQAPAAESLRQATAALRSGGIYTHPYYWAGLEVFQ
jgi:CHAT domain-containing protein